MKLLKIRIVHPRYIDGDLNINGNVELYIEDILQGTFVNIDEAQKFIKNVWETP